MAKTDKPNLEALTTKEIAALYKKTLVEAQKQRGNEQAQNQAREDLGFDLVYHKDVFGNMIEGPAPKAKPTRNYVDASGYVQELGPGEVAPVAPGATLLERIVHFANENRNDPDVAALLPVDEAAFEVTLDESGWLLRGDVNTSGVWHVIAMHDGHDNLKFSLKDDLDRDQAIQRASAHIRAVTDPEPRDLTATELRQIAIMAANATNVPTLADAVGEYLKLATNEPTLTVAYLGRPDRRNLVIAAIYFCWKNSLFARGFVENDDVLGHINTYLDSRDFVTIQTFIDAWEGFKNHQNRGLGGWRLERPEPQPLSEEEMNAMWDEEIAVNLEEARKLVRSERNRA
jgi:hypothetical protein